MRAVVRASGVALAATLLLTPLGSPAVAATPVYERAIDITFPLTADTEVTYRDDYDQCRRSSGGTCVRHHQATDLMVAMGTPVHAAMGGRVSWRSGDAAGPPSYGWMLYVDGDDGRRYAYIHLGAQDGPMDEAYAPGTTPGSRVERGQLLGWAGCSGSARCGGGEHLHFEIHDPDVVDPYDYHDHERRNPYLSLRAAETRGDYANGAGQTPRRFRDVDPASTHGAAIEALADSGITRGCDDGRFCPNDPVTRGQMASFLARALDLPAAPRAPFADVGRDSTHADAIARLFAADITRGCTADTFCPTDPVSRQQMASFLARALDLPRAGSAGFRDVSAANPHRATIDALAASGITRGCAPARYCPTDAVTRAQMASFLVRALDL